MSSGREAVSRSAGGKPHAPQRANGVTCPHPPLHLQSAADGLDNGGGGGGGGGGGARAGGAGGAGGPATSSPLAPSQLEMEAARWDGAGEGGGGDGVAAQGGAAAAAAARGGAAAAADGDVAAEGEAPSWFSRPRLPRAQRASLARRMMVLTKAIIG